MIEFDVLLQQMGRLGPYQKRQLLLLMLPGLLAAIHMGSNVFIGAEIEHWCLYENKSYLEQKCQQVWAKEQTSLFIPVCYQADNSTKQSTCQMFDLSPLESLDDVCEFWWPSNSSNINITFNETLKCNKWQFNTSGTFQSTIVSTFNLVCGETYKRKLSQAFFMCGVTFGAIFWGQISDRFGRKFAMIFSVLLAATFSLINAFAASFYFFLCVRVLIGFTVFPSFSSAFVLATEIVQPNTRVTVGQAAQVFYGFGFCILSLFGYFIRSWRTLQLAIAIPLFSITAYYWILNESPRWLISRRRYLEANKIVKQMLKGTKVIESVNEAVKLDEIATHGNIKMVDSDKHESNEELTAIKHRHGPSDLWRTKFLRRKSFCLFYCWLTASCGYYGLTLNAADLGGDPFINLFLSGLIEMPAYIISKYLMDKWGRRPTLSTSFILSGISCITMQAVTKDMRELNIALSLLGKFGAAAAFGTVYIFASEIYATPIRNVGIGVCSSCARVGGILAPFIAMLSNISNPLPYVVFGGLSIIGGFISLFLPETVGTQLAETVEECEKFGFNQVYPLEGIFRCCRNNKQIIPNVKYAECSGDHKTDDDNNQV